MSSPDAGTAHGLGAEAAGILATADRLIADGRVDDVPDEAVQQLLLAAVRLFAAKRDLGTGLEAFPQGSVTATQVAVTAVALTKAVNLELFELALWNGWSNI